MTIFRALFRRRREFDDLSAEIRTHLEERTAALVAGGMSRADAVRAARRAFGNVGRIEEEARDAWRVPALDPVMNDVRHALRLVRRHPAFAMNVMAISALGIAACATTFSLVSGILLAPLPFPDAARVYEVLMRPVEGGLSASVPIAVYRRAAADSTVIDAISAGYPSGAAVEWDGEPAVARAERITPSFFRVYGIAPALGRAFTHDEGDRIAPVAILGNRLWRSRFRSDSSIVGRTITVDGVSHTVIGVMPPAFRAFYNEEPELWLPTNAGPLGAGRGLGLNAQLRVKPGVDSARAAAWLAAAGPLRVPTFRDGDSVTATPVLSPITDPIYGDVTRPLEVLLAAVLLVLVLVAANVATMQLARTAARDRELAIRRAIGATTFRQAQLLIVESLMLTAAGGAAGTLASYWAVAAIASLGSRVLPRMDTVTLDWRVLVFAGVATVVVGLAGGIAPMLAAPRTARPDSGGARFTGARTSSALVAAQIAFSVMLTVGAGLLVKGFLRVLPSDPGLALADRAAISVSLHRIAEIRAGDSVAARRFLDDVRGRMMRVHGVIDVAATTFAPFTGNVLLAQVDVPGRPAPARPLAGYMNFLTPNYLDVMQVPLRAGRMFTEADNDAAPRVAIVNEAAASRWWPGETSVIGRTVVITNYDRASATVVGVSANARMLGRVSRVVPEIYLPVAQTNPRYIAFIAHTAGAPGPLLRDLQRAVWTVAPRLAIDNSSDLEEIATGAVQRPRFFAWALGAFAVAAVLLTALAVFGLLTLTVVQRRREIGVRMALGASPARIGRAVMARAGALAAAGTAAGVAGALGLTRYMQSLLIEVRATDASVFIGASATLLVVAAIAACAPARRAWKVDPGISLKAE